MVDYTPPPPLGSTWRHRNGTIYRVLWHVRLEATQEVALAYEDVDGYEDDLPWVRPLSEWNDGRFTPVNECAKVYARNIGILT
jgi:hypothetical protein